MIDDVRSRFGVVSWRELRDCGVPRSDIDRSLADGSLVRVRRGWYATSTADPAVVAAVRGGGTLSCLSALRRHGVWVPEHPRTLHLRGCGAAHRTHGASRFCRQFGPPEPEDGPVDDVPLALRHAVRCLDEEGITVVCDSLLHQGLLEPCDLRDILATAPRRIRRLLDRCDGVCESGTESMVRRRLRSLRIGFTAQHWIEGVGRVDFLVGTRLVIEVDSRAHHTGAERYESDRRRDRELLRRGYLVLRLSYAQVVHDWAEVEATLLGLVRDRVHVGGLHNHGG